MPCEQVVNQGGDVADAHGAVKVTVGGGGVDAVHIAGQQIVYQDGHIGNGHAAVSIHVAAHGGIGVKAQLLVPSIAQPLAFIPP